MRAPWGIFNESTGQMTSHTLQRVGLPIARVGVILLAIGVVVLGSSIISLFFGAHPYWWVWVFGVVALAGWAFTGDVGHGALHPPAPALDDPRRERGRLHHVPRLLQASERRPGAPLRRQVPDAGRTSRSTEQRLHLDKPFYIEYFYFVKNFVTGDENGWPGLGYSYGNYVSVRSEIIQRAPRTLFLIVGRGDDLARLRRRDRGALGRQATNAGRPSRDGLRALRDLCARVLARADGALRRLEGARA